MSVLFKPHKSNAAILIAGQNQLAGAAAGIVGPFPNFSIDRQDNLTSRGGQLTPKFTINVNGTATLAQGDPQDITVSGERQASVFGQKLTLNQLNRELEKNYNIGKLSIEPYGGRGNKIIFKDAKLISVNIAEQSEQSAGVQAVEFAFVFEARVEESDNTVAGAAATPAQQEYLLESVQESWELSVNDNQVFYDDGDFDSDTAPKRTYTLTHNISAVGLDKWIDGQLQKGNEAFRQASQYVKERLIDDPFQPIQKDIINDAEFFPSPYLPAELNAQGETQDLGFNLAENNYRAYNHIRNATSNIEKGEYTVTETWVISDGGYAATHSIEANVESDQSQLYRRVTVTATFTGLDENLDVSNNKDEKYKSALKSYERFLQQKIQVAQKFANDSNTGFGTVNPIPISETSASNHVAGTINYSAVFDDRDLEVPGAVSEDVTVEYGNSNGIVDVYAVFQVLGRSSPIIQPMNVTPTTSVNITVSIQMEKGRGKPDGTLLSKPYRGGYDYCKSFTESWNPKTRSYTLNETWEGIAG